MKKNKQVLRVEMCRRVLKFINQFQNIQATVGNLKKLPVMRKGCKCCRGASSVETNSNNLPVVKVLRVAPSSGPPRPSAQARGRDMGVPSSGLPLPLKRVGKHMCVGDTCVCVCVRGTKTCVSGKFASLTWIGNN